MYIPLTSYYQNHWFLAITNLLDILIIALFCYSFFVFLRRTRSYLVFLGLTIAIALYTLAKIFNLQLTFLALQYFVGASVILFVVIFQSEIRKYLELLGLISTRQFKAIPIAAKSPTNLEIIQACIKMAHTKIGSLIVIEARDVLDAYIQGGTQLDGVISEEIILSIFDPHSDGHDGAVVISNNRLAKFGSHLPLSTNFKLLGKRGTRHSAALGLSESTDALCIVTSEEHGTISVCKEGKLKVLNDYADLEKELNKFILAKFNPHPQDTLTRLVKHNFRLKIAALLFAIAIWILRNY